MISVKPFERLAAYASDSVRIKAAVENGNVKTADELLITRMEDVMRGFTEGDAIEDLEVFKALDTINQFRGPAGHFLMVLAARKQIEIMTFESMMKG